MQRYVLILAVCVLLFVLEFPTVSCADEPVSPAAMAKMMGIGLSTNWAKSAGAAGKYSTAKVEKIAKAGFGHIRFRTDLVADNTLFNFLDGQIRDCLDNGMVAVLACKSGDFAWESNPTKTNEDEIVQWWENVAHHYRNYSHKLIFNLNVELKAANPVSKDDGTYLNSFIEATVTAIRGTSGNNGTRIIIMQPQTRGDPYKLYRLNIPTDANGYMMAEWHEGYASGPKPAPHKTKQWSDPPTESDKDLIRNRIAAAVKWTAATGIPTWEGAWMPGNYNKGGDFTIPQQVEFVKIFAGELVNAGIPSCVNATQQFIDNDTDVWIPEMVPVRDALLHAYSRFSRDTKSQVVPTSSSPTLTLNTQQNYYDLNLK